MNGIAPKSLILLIAGVALLAVPARADRPFNGWRRARTEHFEFIFEERDAAAVRELVSFAEDVYQEVTELYGSRPPLITCVVRGRVDSANGLMSPIPPHIDLFVTPPAALSLSSTGESWLRLLLTHELIHYVHIGYRSGVMHRLSLLFGGSLRYLPGAFLPGWMIEGPAVYAETLLTDGGRGRNAFFEMYYKAPIVEDRLFTAGRAAHPSPFPPPGRIYVAGYMLTDFLTRTYGTDLLSRIHRRFVRFPFLGPRRAVESVTGSSMQEIYENMKAALEARYARDARIEDGERVTPEVYGHYYLPQITRKGWILYRSQLGKGPAIVLYDPETGTERILTAALLSDPYSLTADGDGRLVVFSALTSTEGPEGTRSSADLFALDTGTGSVRRVTVSGRLRQPALSPDGARLIAVRLLGAYSCLVEVDLNSGAQSVLFHAPRTNVLTPVFNEDGSTIAFALNAHGTQSIQVLAAGVPAVEIGTGAFGDGLAADPESHNMDHARAITGQDGATDYLPRFSGESLYYGSDRDAALRVYRATPVPSDFSADGATHALVVEDPVGAYAAVPAGDWLVYASYSSDGHVVKRTPMREGAPVSRVPVEPAAPFREWDDIESAPYRDVPRLLFWLPFPLYLNPFNPAAGSLGVGAVLVAHSLTGRSGYQVAAGGRFDVAQPALMADAFLGVGTATLSVQLMHGYTETAASAPAQDSSGTVSVSIPLVSRSRYPWSRAVRVGVGVSHRIRVSRQQAFSLFDSTATDASVEQLLSSSAGITATTVRRGAAKDLYPPLSLYADARASVPLWADGIAANPVAGGTVSTTIPSLIPHQVIRLTGNGWYSPGGDVSKRAVVRADLVPELPPADAALSATVDYLAHIALVDQPLPFGLHIAQIGGGVHIGGALAWADPGAGLQGITADPHIYFGTEVTVLVGTYTHMPLGIGVTARLVPGSTAAFVPSKDLGIYVFIGTNSFLALRSTQALFDALRGRGAFP